MANPFIGKLRAERAELAASMEAISEGAVNENRSELNVVESANFDAADKRIAEIDERLEHLTAIETRHQAAATLVDSVDETDPNTHESRSVTRVKNDPLVYTLEGERNGISFIRDAYAAQYNHDWQASERLLRHSRQMHETRAQDSTNLTGLVVPQYATDAFLPYLRAGSPTADALTQKPLGAQGLAFNFGEMTTGTAAAAQAGENATANATTFDDTLRTFYVETVSAYVETSRQSLERGFMTEDAVRADLGSAYGTELDRQVLVGAGHGSHELPGLIGYSSSNSLSVTAITGLSVWKRTNEAISKITSNVFAPPQVIVMTPARWGWLCAQVDSSNRPLVVVGAPSFNTQGLGEAPTYTGFAGHFAGLPVILDGGMSERYIEVLRTADIWLFTDGPQMLRFDEVVSSTLSVRIVLAAYVMMWVRRAKAIATIDLGSTAAPVFGS